VLSLYQVVLNQYQLAIHILVGRSNHIPCRQCCLFPCLEVD